MSNFKGYFAVRQAFDHLDFKTWGNFHYWSFDLVHYELELLNEMPLIFHGNNLSL